MPPCVIGSAVAAGFLLSLPLSAAFVRSAPPGRHADGNGLYLFVQPTGTRSWVQRMVPLCRRAVEILGSARTLGDGTPLVFPIRRVRRNIIFPEAAPG